MKKCILSILFVLTTALLLSSKANAQTDAECFREYQSKGYKCLQEYNKCIYSCNNIDTLKPCENACSSQDKTCSEQASTDLTACRAAIPKDKEDVPSEAKSGQDCRKIFDKESYKCLGISGDCQRKCGEETKRPDGGAYFNSGEIYSKCTKASDCDGKGRACNEQALANFRVCLDARDAKKESAPEAKKEIPKQNQNNDNKGGSGASFWDATAGKLPLFIGDWYKTMLEGINMEKAILGFASLVSDDVIGAFGKAQDNREREAREYLETLSDDYIYSMTGLRKVQLINMRPSLADDEVQKLIKDEEAVRKIMEAALEKPATPKEVIDVPGRNDIKVYPWGKSSAAVIESPNWENIKFREPVEADGITSHVFELEQGAVEVKVQNNNPSENQFGVDAGWLGVTVSRTHFYIYKNPNEKSAAVIVYEGEVEVKTMGGKTIKVSPENGDLGILVISQKISPVKLVLAGLVVVAVAGSAFMILRRKLSSKGFNKKKK